MPPAPLRLVFMGCPDFAVPALQQLADDPEFEIVAVYCMPDRPKGRGKHSMATPVKCCAIKRGFAVETPATFRQNPEAIATLRSYQPDFLVVVAYGLILSEAVLAIPKIASVNLHASILPAYRGPSPIHQAILDGKKETGNTVMLMSRGMDEGDILAIEKTPIKDDDNLSSLHDRLSLAGALLLSNTLKGLAAGQLTSHPQDHGLATYTKKISPAMARIDWQQPAATLKNLIKAMSPCPGAWFADCDERIKVFKADLAANCNAPAGTIVEQSIENGIIIACGQNTALQLLELQRAGKSRIMAADFLRGYELKATCLMGEDHNNA